MKRLLFLTVILLQFCTYENPYIARIKEEYVPLDEVGNYWIYTDRDGIEKYVEVVENTTNIEFDSREAIILEENYSESYWFKGDSYISRYRIVEVNFNGELYPVEQRWQNYLELPFVKGNVWEDTWSDTLLFFNEILTRTNNLKAEVENYEHIETEAGEFKNCYRIRFHTEEAIYSSIVGDTTVERTYWEWYAPGVGLVKSSDGYEIWQLTHYGKNDDGN
jgi:hypothetical protein